MIFHISLVHLIYLSRLIMWMSMEKQDVFSVITFTPQISAL